ncbi:MAG: ABC transporter substrate-binding protein, partial [Acidimicrobiia bacterium]
MPNPTSVTRALAGVLALALIAASCTGGESGGDDTVAPTVSSSEVAASSTVSSGATTPDGSTTVPEKVPQELVDGAFFADGPPVHIDPYQAVSIGEVEVASLMFNGLTDVVTNNGVTTVVPAVAESWTASEDSKQFTFTLRNNLTFSNSERVLPSAFLRGWDMAADPERVAPFAHLLSIIDGYDEVEAGRAEHLLGVQVDDGAMTITVRLSQPYADFPTRVSHVAFSPMPEARTAAEEAGTWETGMLIGNGPYVLSGGFDPKQFTLTLRTDRTEVGGLAKVTFRSFDDAEASAKAFGAGEVQTTLAFSSDDLAGGALSPLLQTYSWVFGMGDGSALAGADKALLRQAIAMSIDRSAIVSEAMDGLGIVAAGLTPPGAVGYAPSTCTTCRFDIDAAKSLLEQYRSGGGEVPDSIVVVSAEDNDTDERAAKIVVEGLKDLGLKTDVRSLPSSELASELATGSCPGLCRAGWIWD